MEMIELEVKSWETLEMVPRDPLPAFGDEFSVFFEFEVGPKDQIGAFLFSVYIMSYEASKRKKNRKLKKLLFDAFDESAIKKRILSLVDSAQKAGPKQWPIELCKSFYWEYEDYQEPTEAQIQELKELGLWDID